MSTFTQRSQAAHQAGLQAFAEFQRTGILPQPPASLSAPESYWPWYDGFLEGFQVVFPPDCEDGIVIYDALRAMCSKVRSA